MKYDVDPDDVRRLAAGLRRAQTAVTAVGVGAGVPAPALGAAEVARALGEVDRSWSTARRRIAAELDAVASATTVAALTYARVDDGLARSARR